MTMRSAWGACVTWGPFGILTEFAHRLMCGLPQIDCSSPYATINQQYLFVKLTRQGSHIVDTPVCNVLCVNTTLYELSLTVGTTGTYTTAAFYDGICFYGENTVEFTVIPGLRPP